MPLETSGHQASGGADRRTSERASRARRGVRRPDRAAARRSGRAAAHNSGAVGSCRAGAGRRVALRGEAPRHLSRDDMGRSFYEQVTRIGLGLDGARHCAWDRVAIVGDPMARMAARGFRRAEHRRDQLRALSDQLARRGGVRAAPRRRIGADRGGPGARRQGAADARPAAGLRKLVVIDDSNMFGYRDAALMSFGELMRAWRRSPTSRNFCAWPRACSRTMGRRSSTPPAPARTRRARSTRTAR